MELQGREYYKVKSKQAERTAKILSDKLKNNDFSSVDKYIQEHQKPGQLIGKYNSCSIYVSDVKNAALYPKKTILNNKNIRINLFKPVIPKVALNQI